MGEGAERCRQERTACDAAAVRLAEAEQKLNELTATQRDYLDRMTTATVRYWAARMAEVAALLEAGDAEGAAGHIRGVLRAADVPETMKDERQRS